MRAHALACVCALSLALAACGSDSSTGSGGEGGSLTFVSWGGFFQKAQQQAWTEPFAKQTGVKVLQDGPTDYAKLRAQVQSGSVSWDVMDVDGFVGAQQCGKLFERLDRTKVDLSQIKSTYVQNQCGLPVAGTAIILMYDKRKFGANPPTGWKDFFDVKRFPGKRGMWNFTNSGALEAALLADGVAPEQLYPLDLDRAFEKLDTIKSHVAWGDSLAQSVEQIVSGSVAMSLIFSARAYDAAKQKAPYKAVWNQAILGFDNLVIPKGSPNKDTAMRFLNMVAKPAAQARLTEIGTYAPLTRNTKLDVDPLQWSFVPSNPRNERRGFVQDQRWWAQNFDQVNDRWVAWQSG